MDYFTKIRITNRNSKKSRLKKEIIYRVDDTKSFFYFLSQSSYKEKDLLCISTDGRKIRMQNVLPMYNFKK